MKNFLLIGSLMVLANFVVESRLSQENYLEWKTSTKELLVEFDAANDKSDHEQQLPFRRHKRQEAGDRTPERAVPEAGQYTYGNPMDGAGYSSDTQQVAPQRCFNITGSSISAHGEAKLDIALSASQLERILGVSVSASGSYGMFSADAAASYLRSVQDDESSLSLNYYSYTTNEVAVQLAGYGEAALTAFGRSIYKGGGNPVFGLVCGDHFISSYQWGALFTMGLKIKFSSSNEKSEFKGQFGTSYVNIISATAKVESAVKKRNITGSITIQAFQRGGEPSQLAHIFNKDSEENYYALSCSLTTMDMCKKAVSGLLNYATTDFSKQFSTKNNTGLANLGVGFRQITPIDDLELVYPVSLVPPEVRKIRHELASKLKESEYYIAKCMPFLNNKYPVPLETIFLDQVQSLLAKANDNVGILMRKRGGAADCFTFPEHCKHIAVSIFSQLNNITAYDLKFLDLVKYSYRPEDIIYKSPERMIYNAGSAKIWIMIRDYDNQWKFELLELNGKRCTFVTWTERGSWTVSGSIKFITEDGQIYDGYSMYDAPVRLLKERRVLSPFFFELYNDDKQHR